MWSGLGLGLGWAGLQSPFLSMNLHFWSLRRGAAARLTVLMRRTREPTNLLEKPPRPCLRPDAEEVARLAARYPPGFVVPVFSDDVHEIRAYNRLAALARGSVLVMLQVCRRGEAAVTH